MSQKDFTIDNGTGAAVRVDIQESFQALANNSSGSSAPSTNYASQFFANTSTSIMQINNTSGNAFINLFTLAGGPAFAVDGTINSVNIGKGTNSAAGNTCLGETALDAAVTGTNCTAIGKAALTLNTSGSHNTSIGAFSLDANTEGDNNTAVGKSALGKNTTADNNTAVGSNCLLSNETGAANTAVGTNSLDANDTGSNNTGVGVSALGKNTSADNNTALGRTALGVNETGSQNTAVGANSLDANTTADNNTAVGYNALTANTTGVNNVAVGSNCLDACTTGFSNVAAGQSALGAVTNGDNNSAIGNEAGLNITEGNNNLLLGHDAGTASSPSGSITTASNQICIGDDNITNLFIKVSTIQTSDSRDKTDVNDFKHGLSWIQKLRPITYRWDMRSNYKDGIPDGSKKEKKLHLGFIAQEELEIEKEHGFANDKHDMLLVNENNNGNYGMHYDRLIPILVNAIKELSAKVTALEAG